MFKEVKNKCKKILGIEHGHRENGRVKAVENKNNKRSNKTSISDLIINNKEIIYRIISQISKQDILNCRLICKKAYDLSNLSFNEGVSMFWSLFPVIIPLSLLCRRDKETKKLIAAIPGNAEVRLQLDKDIEKRILFLINADGNTNRKKSTFASLYASRIDTFDMSQVICDPCENQFYIEDLFNWDTVASNPYSQLTTLEMPSVPGLLQPDQASVPLLHISGTITIARMNTLEILKCQDIGEENNKFLVDGFINIMNLLSLRCIYFKKINRGPAVRFTHLPSLNTIIVESLGSKCQLEFNFNEIPKLETLVIEGVAIKLPKNRDAVIICEKDKKNEIIIKSVLDRI